MKNILLLLLLPIGLAFGQVSVQPGSVRKQALPTSCTAGISQAILFKSGTADATYTCDATGHYVLQPSSAVGTLTGAVGGAPGANAINGGEPGLVKAGTGGLSTSPAVAADVNATLGYTPQNAATANTNNDALGAAATAQSAAQAFAQNGSNIISGTIAAARVATLNQNTTGQAGTALALAATPTPCSGGQVAAGVLANGNSTGCISAASIPAAGPTISTGSALTNGAGSVQVSSSKTILRDIKSVMDPPYNAACDATTDDQTALQAAFTSGGNIHIPEGVTCNHSSFLNVGSNTNIFCEGSGSTLFSTDTTHIAVQFMTASYSSIKNCTLKNTAGTARLSNVDASGISTQYSSHITISDNWVIGAPGAGIFIFAGGGTPGQSHHNIISGNHIQGAKSNSTIVYSSSFVTLIGNQAEGGGDADYEVTTNILVTDQTHDILVTGNISTNSVSGLLTAGTYKVSFIGNTVTGTTGQPCAQAVSNGGTYTYVKDVVFSNNTLSSCGNGGISLDSVTGGLVQGNQITDTTGNAINVDAAAQDHITIKNNKIRASSLTAIIALGNTNGLTITGNDVNTVTAGSCIRAGNTTSNIQNMMVGNNFCDNITAESSTFYVYDLPSVTNLSTYNNSVGTFSVSPAPLRAPSSTFLPNYFSTMTGVPGSASTISVGALSASVNVTSPLIVSGGGSQQGTYTITGTNGIAEYSPTTASLHGFHLFSDAGTDSGALYWGNSTRGAPLQNNMAIGARTAAGNLIFIHGTAFTVSGGDYLGTLGWGSACTGSSSACQFQVSTAGLVTHPSAQGTGTATFAPQTGAGSGATAVCATSHVCDSFSGEVTLTSGTVPAIGSDLIITLPITRTNQPNCAVELKGGTLFLGDTKTTTTSTITISTGAALAAATAYTINYVCGGN